MKREWRPGDVAWLQGNGIDAPAIRTQNGSWAWVDSQGGNPVNGASFAHETWGGTVRPLVVIDPEDREQVERLNERYYAKRCAGEPQIHALQAALREFANPTPPKPEEPTGLGAVVEGKDGRKWVRSGHSYTDLNWRVSGGNVWFAYDAIDAVRVLSEGVTP